MAGARIETVIENGAQLDAALQRIAALGRRPEAMLTAIGIAMARNTRARFNAGVDPDGQRWHPLNAIYASGKKTDRILVESGMSGGLQGSITSEVGAGQVAWGSNKVYAAIHQFGGVIQPKTAPFLVFRMGGRTFHRSSVFIPARPYLGLSAEDRRDVLEVAGDFLARAVRS